MSFCVFALGSGLGPLPPGEENNTQYNKLYAQRDSYGDASFDFAADLTTQYLAEKCRQWYNLGVPRRIVFGGTTFAGDTISGVGAMRTVLATFDEKRLAKVGKEGGKWLGGGFLSSSLLSLLLLFFGLWFRCSSSLWFVDERGNSVSNGVVGSVRRPGDGCAGRAKGEGSYTAPPLFRPVLKRRM